MAYFCMIFFLFATCFYSSFCDKFFYFAYGSNLLVKRLKINSPSAEFFGVAVLENYRLDFDLFNKKWNGTVATIVENPGQNVTGALWVLDEKDLVNLDKQEGVDQGWYFAKNVTVTTMGGDELVARTYELVVNPTKLKPGEDIPRERRPSNTYLEVLIFGAVECGLPSEYIGYLVSFPTNGQQASDEIRTKLGYPFGPQVDTERSVKEDD